MRGRSRPSLGLFLAHLSAKRHPSTFREGRLEMSVVEACGQVSRMATGEFLRRFEGLIRDKTFSAVASGTATDGEIRLLGVKLHKAGLADTDLTDRDEVTRITCAMTSKVFNSCYRP